MPEPYRLATARIVAAHRRAGAGETEAITSLGDGRVVAHPGGIVGFRLCGVTSMLRLSRSSINPSAPGSVGPCLDAGAGTYLLKGEGPVAGVDPLIIVAGYVVVAGLAIILAIRWWC